MGLYTERTIYEAALQLHQNAFGQDEEGPHELVLLTSQSSAKILITSVQKSAIGVSASENRDSPPYVMSPDT